jgi:hypothetical protein
MNNNNTEKAFQMNLIRLARQTSAVTIDHMFEFLIFTNNNAVAEVQFVEESYLGHVFNNERFINEANIPICSFQLLFENFQEAKKKQL